jgi:hypothetical protein
MQRQLTLVLLALAFLPFTMEAQNHVHTPGMQHTADSTMTPRQPGHAAFAAIAEVVRILQADASTDWSKVDIEALRQHLIDMDDVTMRAVVERESIPGGARFKVTGPGRVGDAVRRMSTAHAAMASMDGQPRMTVEMIPSGARVTVLSRSGSDREVSRIRALGFVGMLTQPDHHAEHHLMIARGGMSGGHSHK